jgi:hypothetical protein
MKAVVVYGVDARQHTSHRGDVIVVGGAYLTNPRPGTVQTKTSGFGTSTTQ